MGSDKCSPQRYYVEPLLACLQHPGTITTTTTTMMMMMQAELWLPPSCQLSVAAILHHMAPSIHHHLTL